MLLCVGWSKLTSHQISLELQRTYTKQTLKELQMYGLSGFASDMEFKEYSWLSKVNIWTNTLFRPAHAHTLGFPTLSYSCDVMDAPIKSPNYKEDVDFEALALQDVDFAKVLNANKGILDFHDPQAVK